MKAIILFFIFLSSPNLQIIEECIDHIQSNFPDLSQEQIEALSIGAPEIIRYNEVQNFLETELLELGYVNHGHDLVDFSIGPFQMKPSFIERLEHEIQTNEQLSEFSILMEYTRKDVSSIRKERLGRISNPSFQIKYLEAFSAYCELAYPDSKNLSTTEKLKFKATAYNLGFDKSFNEITQYQSKKHFPFGSKYQGKQYAYSELSLEIYNHLSHE